MKIFNKIALIIVGVLGTLFTIYMFAPNIMIKKDNSPYSFEETIDKISKNIEKEGWSLLGIKRLDKSIAKHGHTINEKVALIEICHPEYAKKIISAPEATHISVMMPCTIAVYETANHKVYISHMNIKPIAWLFGGTVQKIMGNAVAKAQKKFILLN